MEPTKLYEDVKYRLMGGVMTRREAEQIAQLALTRGRLPETREVRFYMSEDGEVLSNKRFPVTHPELRIAVLNGGKPYRFDDVHDPIGPPIETRYYKAQKISVPA